MLGSIISGIAGLAGGLFNAKKQEDFAKNSLSWKAADAERAGISKIFAMGAPTTSFAPVSTGDFSQAGAAIDKQMGQGGQHSTTTGKISGTTAAIQSAQLDGLRIDNDIKRAELASKLQLATQPGAGGVLDRAVTTGPNGVEMKKQLVPGSPDAPQRSFGVSPEVDLYQTATGGYAPAPPQNLSEVHENNAIMRWQYMARNQLLPFMYDEYKSPPYPAPATAYWQFNPLTGEYHLQPQNSLMKNYKDYWKNRNRQEHTR